MKNFTFVLLLLCVPLIGWAQTSKTITSITAGTLTTVLTPSEKISVKDLIITSGTIDKRDFDCMKNEMTVLENIDIQGTSIVAYNSSPANVLPESAFSYNYSSGKTSLKTVLLPSSVTALGLSAFNHCTNLTNINYPSSLLTIGDNCFEECHSFTNGNLPNTVTSLGMSCFYFCSSLESLTLPSSITEIPINCFVGCDKIKKIDLPSGLTVINDGAFSGCKSIKLLDIPLGVNYVGDGSFWGCTDLAHVSIPNTVPSIGENTFNNCDSLRYVFIPNSVTYMGDSAFSNCKKLTKAYFWPADHLDGADFFENRATGFTILQFDKIVSNNVWNNNYIAAKLYIANNISISPFSDDIAYYSPAAGTINNLLSAITPSNVKKLIITGFLDSSDLDMIRAQMPNLEELDLYMAHITNNEIPSNAFQGMGKLIKFYCPYQLTSIGDHAFENCSSLTEITLSQSLGSIGDYSFDGCSNLMNIYSLPVVPPTVTTNTFNSVNKSKCHLYGELLTAYPVTPVWNQFYIVTKELDQLTGNKPLIFSSESGIHFSGLTVNDILDIYSASGKLLKSVRLSTQQFDIDLPQGVYIIKYKNQIFKVIR